MSLHDTVKEFTEDALSLEEPVKVKNKGSLAIVGRTAPHEIKRLTKRLRKLWLQYPTLTFSEITDSCVMLQNNDSFIQMLGEVARARSKVRN